jgi:hypothetical protein
MAEVPNPLTKLLSDFLLGYSKAKQPGLDQHPLIQIPAMQRLAAEYLVREPDRRALPAQDVAMGALGEYWARFFKPDRLTLAFRDEWRQYLVLAVAYFVPFRRRLGASGAVQARLAYPQSYGKLGDLLSDADYLAGVLAEETGHQYEPVRVAEFCRALVPNTNDRAQGVKPATTVASSRAVAIAALAGSLEAYLEQSAQVLAGRGSSQDPSPAVSPEAMEMPPGRPMSVAVATPQASGISRGLGATFVDGIAMAGADDRQLPALLSFLDHSLARWESMNDSPALAARAHRLAQQLAAISQGITPTAEPTTDLTGPNVQLALRRVGTANGDWRSSDLVLDQLAHLGVLRREGDRWGFAHSAVELFFAAEYLAGDQEHWVSLQPGHRRLMRWLAAVLARRADDWRNDWFCQDLGRALSGWSPVILLDVADILAQFRHSHTPATLRFQDWLGMQLKELANVPSGWLNCRLWQCSQELGIDLGLLAPDRPPEPMVPPPTLEAKRLATDVPEFISELGLPKTLATRVDWYEDRRVVRALLNSLPVGSDQTRQLTAAAWLRQSSLQTYVDLVVGGSRIWNTHRATALEIVAEMAKDRHLDEPVRALARSILATDDHLLGLAAADCGDRALAYTLQLMLDVRLFFSQHQRAWLVYRAAV